ncbi:MAG: hypothetical protein WC302_02630 [Candidatus Paceibacterota bacterium]|jgi:hypothetical protein
MDTIYYVIAAVIIIAIIWFAMKGKKKGNTPMNPPTPPTGGQGM